MCNHFDRIKSYLRLSTMIDIRLQNQWTPEGMNR
jgi:hypothetical protein